MATEKRKPRNKVTTSYRKVSRTRKPKAKQPKAQVTPLTAIQLATFGRREGPRTPLCQYIEENLESGLPIHELVMQFQEYDCEHRWYRTGIYPNPDNPQHLVCCAECGLGERRKGLGSATQDHPKWEFR